MQMFVVVYGVLSIGAVIAHLALGVSLGLVLLALFVGWPVIGTLVTADDDLPGGWSNPDGTVRPRWLQSPFWGQITAGLAMSTAGFAADAGFTSRSGAEYMLIAVGGAFLAAALITRRWWLAAGMAVGFGALWL